MRSELSLNGVWRFQVDPHADGEALGFWREACSLQAWSEMTVPSCFDAACPSLYRYTGWGWYRRTFSMPREWQGRRVVLCFGAVNYRAKVWLNGRLLGEHLDGFLPFEFDIHDHACSDRENVLTVLASNAPHEGDVPGTHVQWRGFGGILRNVSLCATPRLHLRDLRITALPAGAGGQMDCRVAIRNARRDDAQVAWQMTVVDPAGTCVAELGPWRCSVPAGATLDVAASARLDEARCWSPETPQLYRLVVRLTEGSAATDAVETRFGFRRIEASPEGLRLNGAPVFLVGFNRHEDSPRTGMAVDPETTRQDLLRIKETGANFVRLCHYPHDPSELDLCDEIGLMAMCEIPLNLVIDPARAETAHRQVAAMVARDFNHPSVVFWSVGNETNDEDAFAAEANRALIRTARALDATRLCVHVSHRWKDHPNFDEDDVMCVNYYPSIAWKGRRGSSPDADLTRSMQLWREQLDVLRQRYPGKPILITEFGYLSFGGTNGHAMGEDMHARVIEAEADIMRQPQVCGSVIWCWADHPWPPPGLFEGLSMSPFGVLTRQRVAKKAFWAARKVFHARRALALAAPPDASRSPRRLVMIRPHVRDIPVVSFPEGYGIRPMSVSDIGLWTDIERDAERFIDIRDDLFEQEFGYANPAIGWRCFIVTGPRGLGVGTISAWCDRNFRGQDYGRIHWVAIRSAHQGRGLGKAALAYAMRVLAQWHERCYLVTSSERLVAVRLYLDFGFEPDLAGEGELAKWRDLAGKLDHPRLHAALS